MEWLELGIIGIFIPVFVFIFIVYRDFLNWRNREMGGEYLITIIDRKLHRLRVSPGMLTELLDRGEVLMFLPRKKVTDPALPVARR